MAVTTATAIRDRISTVITGLTPTVMAGDRFLETRNEYGGNFESWAKSHPTAALRRFSVRDTGVDSPAKSTNTTEEYRFVRFRVTVAYPQTHRYGAQASLDRDDVRIADQHQIETAIGARGGANFTSSFPNADWTNDPEATTEVTFDDGIDFLVIEQTMGYWRTM